MTDEQIRFNQCHGQMQETDNGVVYDWGLAGPQGAWFTLFRESHHTDEDMLCARRWLRNNRDIVSVQIVRV